VAVFPQLDMPVFMGYGEKKGRLLSNHRGR
jgi:hypothetical protein